MDKYICKCYVDSKSTPENWVKRRCKPGDPDQHEDPDDHNPAEEPYSDDENGKAHTLPEANSIPDLDLYINAEVLLLKDGEHMQVARVVGQAWNEDSDPIGEYNLNLILNTRLYDVMFPYGSIQQYAANLIAENIYSQVDEYGHRYPLMNEIVDHRKEDTAYDKADGFITDKYGKRSRRTTTKGWKLLVNWKDGTQLWIPLTKVKDSNPIKVEEYAVAKGIDEEPVFAWWVPFTMRKCDRIIAAVNEKTKRKTHKYNIKVPRSIAHAYELDQKNADTFWRDVIKKEMTNVLVAFDILECSEDATCNFKELGVHLIFDVISCQNHVKGLSCIQRLLWPPLPTVCKWGTLLNYDGDILYMSKLSCQNNQLSPDQSAT